MVYDVFMCDTKQLYKIVIISYVRTHLSSPWHDAVFQLMVLVSKVVKEVNGWVVVA